MQDIKISGEVKFVPIEIKVILDLAQAFESIMDTLITNVDSSSSDHMQGPAYFDELFEDYDKVFNLTHMYSGHLKNMAIASDSMIGLNKASFVWQSTAQVIELAVVSCAGAHIQSFDIDLIGKDISTFRVLQKFKYHDASLNQLDLFSPISSNDGMGVGMCHRNYNAWMDF